MLLITAAATVIAIDRLSYFFDRNRIADEQRNTVIQLSAHMNRYSENIAELLLLGRSELDDFYAARSSLDEGLSRLSRLVEQEIAMVPTSAERVSESREAERVQAMRILFESIDLTTLRLLFLREHGQQDEAIRLFREDIEERLDADLEDHIDAAINDEQRELQMLQARTEELQYQFVVLVLLITSAAIIVSAGAGAMLTRSLTKPIREMIRGTFAIGEGDLSYRIDVQRKDEFADLAYQFNRTAAQLERHRRDLLDVQAGLEGEVERRTGQLAEANDRLKRLDQMRMLFLADIGHELRTPLTVLRGEAEVALRSQRPVEELRETLERIGQLASQMGYLVEDLLFLARAEVGAVRFEMQRLILQDVMEIVFTEGRILAGNNGVHLRETASADPISISADAQRLTQAFLIVLDNAVKYSDPGGSVDVALTCHSGMARVSVSNSGAGIPESDLPYVFNRFYRGQCNGRATSGSGLGLSIAKWIVDAHNGSIVLQSNPTETVVTIDLPISA
jgi:two-component system, OmpR family, sensor kinase